MSLKNISFYGCFLVRLFSLNRFNILNGFVVYCAFLSAEFV